MTPEEGTWLKGYAVGTLCGVIFGGVVAAGCTSPTIVEKKVEVEKLVAVEFEPDPKADFAAVQFYDCDQLTAVFFIKENGGAEGVRIVGPAHLDDMKLRVSKLYYNNVHYFENNRPCGYTVPEKDVL